MNGIEEQDGLADFKAKCRMPEPGDFHLFASCAAPLSKFGPVVQTLPDLALEATVRWIVKHLSTHFGSENNPALKRRLAHRDHNDIQRHIPASS